MWLIILIFLVFLIIYFFLDFRIGRKIHQLIAKPRNYPEERMDWEMFGDGKSLFEKLYNDIYQAKDHIHILFFIIRNDKISLEFIQLLKKKAHQGVTVRLLLDRVGGYKLSKKQIKSLKNAGVQFSYANQPSLPFVFFSLQHRNHRKITVIDGKIGYFGGFNIGEEYLGRDPELGFWRDLHLRITGEAVQTLQMEFLHDWENNTKQQIQKEAVLNTTESKGQTLCRFLPTDGNGMVQPLLEMFQHAKREIIIASPYFIPGKQMLDTLIQAANRGVHIIILVPLRADHPLVKEASFPYFRKLLEVGCHIHRYDKGFYHGKIIMIDREICDFGTANFDKRSFFVNDELNCFIKDQKFNERIYQEIMKDLDNARELTMEDYQNRPIGQRPIEVISSLLSGLL